MFSEAKNELQALRETISAYQDKAGLPIQPSIDPKGSTFAWKEVIEAVKLAKAREEGDDQDKWTVKRCCTTIIETIPAFEGWLKLLPDGDYGAIVCGVFSMVVSVRHPILATVIH